MTGEIAHLRILIVDDKPYTVGLLRGILNSLGISRVSFAANTDDALELLATESYDAVFCDDHCSPLNPVAFSKAVRRDPGSNNPLVPVFFVTSGARRRQIELARDCGANDVIVRPCSINTLRVKLRSVIEKPKSFIQSEEFFGPDRRRTKQRAYAGEDRRKRKPKQVKISARRKDAQEGAGNTELV